MGKVVIYNSHLGNKIYHHEKLTNFYCCDIGLGSIFILRVPSFPLALQYFMSREMVP